MKNNFLWIALTLLLSVLIHLYMVWKIPEFITQRAGEALKVNQFIHGKLNKAGEDRIVQSSPDIVYSAMKYQIKDKALRFKFTLPQTDTYWSISFFARNTDNFFILNDKKAQALFGSKEVILILLKSGMKYKKSDNEEIIIAPSNKGILLLRMVVKDRNNTEEIKKIEAAQKKSRIEEIDL